LLIVVIVANAQKSIPAFGAIDKQDMVSKDCDFDKGATAEKLIDWGNTYYKKGDAGRDAFKTIFERRTRVKILREQGLSFANVKIPFYSHEDEERIVRLNACTYNMDSNGNIITAPVTKSSIYTKRINKKYSEVIIAFPDVKIGSVIEYQYTMERQTMGQLRDWFFQERIPVKYSEYQLVIPQTFRFSVQPSVIDPMEQKQKVVEEILTSEHGSINVRSVKTNYIMHNLPGIKDEPYMGAVKDYMQRLEFQLKQIDYGNNYIADLRYKWSDIIKELKDDEDFGVQLETEVANAASFVAMAKTIADTETRIKYIYLNLRKMMDWNETEAIYCDRNINKAWETKEGNSATLNLLLVKLLNDAGVKAAPMLLSTRDNGMVTPYYPFINQFNTVLAYVVINDKYFVLDATDKISDYRLVPEKIVNTKGFIVTGDEGQWKEVTSGRYKYKLMTAVHGEVDAAGMMKGDALVNCFDYAKRPRCENWLKNKDEFKEAYFVRPNTTLKIEDLSVNNADADSLPLEQKIKFSTTLNSSGNYKYFTVSLFSDLDKNPFVADDRIADIDFGVPQEYTMFGNYTIPEDYVFDVLPENISMIMPDTSIIFSRSMQADENSVSVKISVEFKRTTYPAYYYPEIKEFYKKLFAKLNEQIVIKKKGT
jgi:hypothetical protein